MTHYLHTHHAQPKIPGIVVLVVLGVFVAGLASLFKPQTKVLTQDATILERVDVANVRDSSVTVYWRTKQPTTGSIVYGTSPTDLTEKAFDERDVQGSLVKRHNHVVTLTHLKGESQVYYKINVDDKLFGQTAQVPYALTTARQLTHPREEEPLYGTIAHMDGSTEDGIVVIAHVSGARPLLTQTHADGTFLIPLCCVYDGTTGEPLNLDPASKIRFEVIRENGASLLVQSTLADAHPMSSPIIVDAPLTPPVRDVADASSVPQTSGVPADTSSPEVLAVSDRAVQFQNIDIIFPLDGGAIPGTRPLIKGFGEPGMDVKGTLTPENRLFQVTVDQDRYWMYEPSFDFDAGEHELTIETRDGQGKLYTLTRTFTILKSGESVLGDATGSAELTPTPTVEVTATPSPTLVPSTTPPVTGINLLPMSLVSLLLIVIGAGIVLLF